MTGLVVYYGTTSPDAGWAVALSDTDVVLQPYHPILMERAYRRTFPGASRFVYREPHDHRPVAPATTSLAAAALARRATSGAFRG